MGGWQRDMGIPSETLKGLDGRREALAGPWYEAIAGSCDAAKSAQEVRQPEVILTHPVVRNLLDFDRPLGLLQVTVHPLHSGP